MSKMEMEWEEAAKQKQKRAEVGDSSDPKRIRVVGIDHSDDEESEDLEMDEDGGQVEENHDGICAPRSPSPTDEEKAKMAECSQYFIDRYGTDDPEAIDCMVEKKKKAYAAKNPPIRDEYEEHKPDDKELQVLLHVEQQTRPFTGARDLQPNTNLFLLRPWVDADSTSRNKNWTSRTLDMYYKRFFPCVESACSMIRSHAWNRVPEVDAQYLLLYSKLCDLIKQEERSWISFFNSTPKNRKEYKSKAQTMAKELNLNWLNERDITECREDVFSEGDAIAVLKLKLEYDMFLLDSEFDTGLRRESFKPRDHTPVFKHIVYFSAGSQQSKFDLWMKKMKELKLTKEECKKELNALHEKNLKEYCGTRISYVKFKRAWAMKLGIISEETC